MPQPTLRDIDARYPLRIGAYNEPISDDLAREPVMNASLPGQWMWGVQDGTTRAVTLSVKTTDRWITYAVPVAALFDHLTWLSDNGVPLARGALRVGLTNGDRAGDAPKGHWAYRDRASEKLVDHGIGGAAVLDEVARYVNQL